MSYPLAIMVLAALCPTGCTGGSPDTADAGLQPRAMALPTSPAAATCEVVEAGRALPAEVRETSGLAVSATDSSLFWTHNDAGNRAELFGIGGDGRLRERVRVTGATLVDWEDLEAARCGESACLYVGDIGDNDGERVSVTIYRVPEPAAGSSQTAPAEAIRGRYPDGPRDAEALFAAPSGDLYIVTKGRPGPAELYRLRAPQRTQGVATLERVRELFAEPHDPDDRVTAATATPDGRWVGIRTYRALYLYPLEDLVGTASLQPRVVDLSNLPGRQGEAIAMANDGTVWLSSEAEDDDARPLWARLACQLDPR